MILIVDDRQENIFSLKRILELNGFEVDTADSGEEALKKTLKKQYALIILDVQMPGMDGFEVAEALSGFRKAKDTPIIFLSAVNTDKKFITKGFNSGGIDYITKPVDPDILILKVRTFYRLYEQTKALYDAQLALQEEIDVRKRAEEALKLKVEEQHTILETLPQIAFMADASGRIEYVNEHWYTYADTIDKFPEPDMGEKCLKQKIQDAIAAGKPLVTEVRLKQLRKDVYRHYLLKMMPVMLDGAAVNWVGTFTDIHEQKTVNEMLEQHVAERTQELVESNRQLEATNFDLQQFASVASHDLKEPLRKIQVFSSIIKDKYNDECDSAIASYIERIIESSQRMSGLITDLLSYSRLSASELFKPVDLNSIISIILEDLEITVKEKGAILHIANLPIIEAIPGQIKQVFQNIISNAIKFSQEGVAPEISISAERVMDKDFLSPLDDEGEYYRISVSDNGIGFDEKYLHKIFTIFQRLNARQSYEGTGIGLAIAKRIIENHNGLITARSQVDQGATFVIVLPLKRAIGASGNMAAAQL
ncbi:MAG: response regulator [Sphingobacteriales bacterium]|nr:MAG: response regulator [Sphingobacteriales bacterium]